ncbi:hypothetical protein FPV67DRAFT_1041375 [Lyophyllum atratum]|nr:hypothetical protein FPV67DRAFT_1041375 [Lyophyllum atratum]
MGLSLKQFYRNSQMAVMHELLALIAGVTGRWTTSKRSCVSSIPSMTWMPRTTCSTCPTSDAQDPRRFFHMLKLTSAFCLRSTGHPGCLIRMPPPMISRRPYSDSDASTLVISRQRSPGISAHRPTWTRCDPLTDLLLLRDCGINLAFSIRISRLCCLRLLDIYVAHLLHIAQPRAVSQLPRRSRVHLKTYLRLTHAIESQNRN